MLQAVTLETPMGSPSFILSLDGFLTLQSIGLFENIVKMQMHGPHLPPLLKYNLLDGYLGRSFVTSSSRR